MFSSRRPTITTDFSRSPTYLFLINAGFKAFGKIVHFFLIKPGKKFLAPVDCTTTPAALPKVASIPALRALVLYSISGSALTDTTTLMPSLVAVERAMMLFLPRKLRTRSGFNCLQIFLSFSFLFVKFLIRPSCSSFKRAEKTL